MIKFSKSFHKISIFEINAGKADFSTIGSAGLKRRNNRRNNYSLPFRSILSD